MRVKQKLHRKQKGACKSSWSRRGSQKTFTLTILWHLEKACEDLSWNHCTLTPFSSETNAIAERAARGIKEGTSAVFLQSGLGESWWADSMECYCYLRNIQDRLSGGKTPHERRFGSRRDGVPKACQKQAVAGPQGSRTCVCASTFVFRSWHTQERRANERPAMVPSSRRGKYLQSDAQGGKIGLPVEKCMWLPRGTGTTVLTYPCKHEQPAVTGRRRLCARVTGKAGENGQYSAAGLRAHPGQDRQLPDVVTRPRPQQASA